MSKKRKIVLLVLAVVVLGTIIIAAVKSGSGSDVAVRVEPVTRRDLVAIVRASGWVRPHRAVDVQSDIMGRVTELRVKEGDTVKRGDVLLRIDPSQYEAAVAQARAGVSAARAREAQSRANQLQADQALSRAQEMRQRDSTLVSPQALEEAETQARVQAALEEAAKFGIEQAVAARRQSEDQLSKTVIRAPIDGVITRLNVEEGETAVIGTMANPRSLLLTISDMNVMETVVRVDETDVPDIQLGDSAKILIDAFPKREFVGRVTEIAHSSVVPPEDRTAISSQSSAVDFEVVLTLDHPPTILRPDLSATAEIVTAVRPKALSIPIIALTVREKKDLEPMPQETPEAQAAADALDLSNQDVEGVFIVHGNKATFTRVKVGITGQEQFEVLDGLAEGDTVVAGPYEAIRNLTNGKTIRITGQAAAPAGEGAS
ncbi:MAG TPA: efflux RND transporter periplasmic adaptor subunit [Longimicrobiales bacterium]|nr:efflux RND transporter periplasmic adaptor subunit [Longimicrobiales bacterium]